MSSKETNTNQEAKQTTQPIDKIASTYAATEKSLADIETRASVARREIREQSEGYARVQEERQRASAQWDYEEAQRRREVKDKQTEEDRDRDRRHAEREAALAIRERQLVETVSELLGPVGVPFDPKQAKQSLDKKLADAEAKGKTIATEAAKREYETKKSIDDANAAKDKALLEAENTRLKTDNVKLEAEVKRLSEVNTDLAKRQGDLARDAFQAAGTIQAKATDSLQAAAQGPRIPGRG